MNSIEKMSVLAEEIEDPRDDSAWHLLSDILVIALLSVMSGGNGWEDMTLYGKAKYDWLKQFLQLPHGIPCKDTFRRVISRLKPDQLTRWMVQWSEALVDCSEGRLIPIDGKALRHSFDTASAKASLHLVSAWASNNRLTLGQIAVEEKSNEITAIPQLLELIDIKGAVVTIDAMGCQTAIAEKIIDQKGDYLLAVKGNQPSLETACVEAAIEYHDDPTQHPETDSHQETQTNRGREEERHCYTIPLPEDSELKRHWKGAKAIVQVISYCTKDGKTTEEVRYYISSLLLSAAVIANYIRGHWGIENSLHWVLDVTFREDDCRIRKDHGDENIACLRRMAAGILRQEDEWQLAQTKPSKRKLSVRQKRLLSGWNNDYLQEILSTELGEASK